MLLQIAKPSVVFRALRPGTAALASPFSSVQCSRRVCPLLQEAEPKAEYWKMHCDPATVKERNGGTHFFYLEEFLKRNGGGQGWVVGTDLSIAGQFQGEGQLW